MDPLGTNPLGILTFIVAPAILTNAPSVMALGTANRFARAIDRARALSFEVEGKEHDPDPAIALRIRQLHSAERRALLLVRALTAFYLSVGSFAAASLVSLLGGHPVGRPCGSWWRNVTLAGAFACAWSASAVWCVARRCSLAKPAWPYGFWAKKRSSGWSAPSKPKRHLIERADLGNSTEPVAIQPFLKGGGPMKSHTEYLTFNIPARMAFVNITPQVEEVVRKSGVQEGLVLCNAMHITASVFINDDEPGLHARLQASGWRSWPRSTPSPHTLPPQPHRRGQRRRPPEAAGHGPRGRRGDHRRASSTSARGSRSSTASSTAAGRSGCWSRSSGSRPGKRSLGSLGQTVWGEPVGPGTCPTPFRPPSHRPGHPPMYVPPPSPSPT